MKNTHPKKNTERFSRTVEHYVHSRPNYPQALMEYLVDEKVVSPTKVIADIGSGTGIFAKQLLDVGANVIAVEPNSEMLEAAKQSLVHYANFTSVQAPAEATGLKDSCLDVITVATAFHWFDRQACAKEFKRILKPDGKVAIIGNTRNTHLAPILQDYETLLRKYCPDYNGIPSLQIPEEEFLNFFADDSVELKQFDHKQQLDLEGLIGRLSSTSYSLTPGQESYSDMIADLEIIFNRYQVSNKVTFPYLTKLHLGYLR